jgi:hypothetical protein
MSDLDHHRDELRAS